MAVDQVDRTRLEPIATRAAARAFGQETDSALVFMIAGLIALKEFKLALA